MESVDPRILNSLTKWLDLQKDKGITWFKPEVWVSMSKNSSLGFAPVTAQAIFHEHIAHMEVSFSKFSASQKDSFIVFRALHQGHNSFGRINSIFSHRVQKETKVWKIYGSMYRSSDHFHHINTIRFQELTHHMFRPSWDCGTIRWVYWSD